MTLGWLLCLTAFFSAQTIPHNEAETLSGKKIVLPDTAAGHPAILVVGFSRAGGDSSGKWDKQLRKDFAGDTNLRFYNIAVLAGAPKLVRGMIRHGMRGSIPKDEHDSFVLLYEDEAAWQKLAGFSDANDAYVLLVDSSANIRWRGHGKAADALAEAALKAEIAKIER